MAPLDPTRALLQLRRDGPALAEAAQAAGLDAAVPSCPGWTVRDLLAHTGGVYAHKAAVLRDRLAHPPQAWAKPPEPDAALDYFTGQLDELVAALRAVDPATPVWSWYPPDQTAGFWFRRMAQETVIHRADAELARGEPHHVDALVALDGIDELLERFVGYGLSAWGRAVGGSGQTVAVLTADARWRLHLQADGVELVRDVPPVADVTLAGTPSHVLYWLWGRLGDEVVDLRGAPDNVALLRRTLRAATQ